MNPALKTVVYRGGVVTFRLPECWIEHYQPEGGGEFYEDGPDTPTLRLNVLTMKGASATTEAAAGVLEQKAVDEDGMPLLLHRWEIAQALPPHHLRVVMFTLTILASQEHDAAIGRTIALLDAEIRRAELAPMLGVSGLN